MEKQRKTHGPCGPLVGLVAPSSTLLAYLVTVWPTAGRLGPPPVDVGHLVAHDLVELLPAVEVDVMAGLLDDDDLGRAVLARARSSSVEAARSAFSRSCRRREAFVHQHNRHTLQAVSMTAQGVHA